MGVRTVSQTIDLKNQLGAAATSKYITDISSTGITVHPSTVGQNIYYTQISDGFYIKQMTGSSIDATNDTTLTSIKANEIILGASNQAHTTIDADSMTIYNGINKLVDIDGGTTKGMIIYDGQGNTDQHITASFLNDKMVYQEQGVPIFQIKNSNNNNIITTKIIGNPGRELAPGDGSSLPSGSYIRVTTDIATKFPVVSMNQIRIYYYWNIATSGFPSNEDIIILTPDNTPYTIEYNDSTIATFDFYQIHENYGVQLRALVDDLSAGLTVGFKMLEMSYTTTTVATCKIIGGAFANQDDNNLFTLGNGTSTDNTSNAFTVDWQGNIDCDNLFFHSGDIYDSEFASIVVCSGLITTSTTEVHFVINSPKRLDYITRASIITMKGAIRGIDGYVDGKNTNETSLLSGYTVTTWILDSNTIKVRLQKDSALSNATNNTPVAIAIKRLRMALY